MRVIQTISRPRAHRAVGRWPPVSRAGRRVEKNVFSRSRRVKPPEGGKVKESCGGLLLYLHQGIVIAGVSGMGKISATRTERPKHDQIRLGRAVEPFLRGILLLMGFFSGFCVCPPPLGRRSPVGPAHAIYGDMPPLSLRS